MTPLPASSPATGPGTIPTRIGVARPSHLLTTTGVGAIVDLPSMSVVVRGLDTWRTEHTREIVEPRLLATVRQVVPSVRRLLSMPREADDDPWSRTGVPVTPFPRWLRCPACARFGPLDRSEQFVLVHRNPRRPDRAKWVHSRCGKQQSKADRNRRACIPARFLVVCEAGHLDEFPYAEFVHGPGTTCEGSTYRMFDAASTLGPQVTISCDQCHEKANIQRAAGSDGSARLPRCRGRHPHLQRFETCGRELRLIVLGASNLWFSVTASALHLPTGASVTDLVAEHAPVLTAQTSPDVVEMLIAQVPSMAALRDVPIEEVWKEICELRDRPPAAQESLDLLDLDLLDEEWKLLSRPTTDKQDNDFKADALAEVPAGYESLIDQVVQVKRLREIQALVGFTRLHSPSRRDADPDGRLPLATKSPRWLPATEQRGEGIFLELRETAVADWAGRVADHPRLLGLAEAHHRWAHHRAMTVTAGFPIARYLLIHTLSHLLVRQVALECGYSAASIRERLYIGTPDAPTAGLLLSTAASDSEGTLGGLVALGEPSRLALLLDAAMRDAARCSSDPLCAEHLPGLGDSLHNAACHACLFVSETSCENGNRWLDRAVLVDLPDASDFTFTLTGPAPP